MEDRYGIETLLDLDGVIIEQKGKCWTKFEVKRASDVSKEIPHGLRYSLTLHDSSGKRIMGFDNAHLIRIKKNKKFHAIKTYDHHHRHSKDRGVPYEFIDAHQLLNDFWLEVDKILNDLVPIEGYHE